MKENESSELFYPRSAEELIAQALLYIRPDRTVQREIEDDDGNKEIVTSEVFNSVDLDRLPDDSWGHTLLAAAETIFRTLREREIDQERLQILAMFLGAYDHDQEFLAKAASLIEADPQGKWISSPWLPFTNTTENMRKFRETPLQK